jgi:hypothetical protein
MFNSISWGTFFTCMGVATLLYYLSISLLFFRQEIQDLLAGKKQLFITPPAKAPAPGIAGKELTPQTHSTAASADARYMPDIDQLEKIINELRYEVIPKAGGHATKEKLAVLFHNYLSTLGGNMPVPFKNSINQLMIKEAAEQCGLSFQEQELQQLW